ncbi:MAG TPA: hypothetical protein VK619_01920 [Pyrinomonadaceae bacterium]|nr:hypothetical protein [Pyrinomonadaceae bacterium]
MHPISSSFLILHHVATSCAECGEPVSRTRWRIWHSRRFCPTCSRRFRKAQLVSPLLAGLCLFLLGLAAGRAVRSLPPPLIVERTQMPPLPMATRAEEQQTETAPASLALAPQPEPGFGPNGTRGERPTDPNEIISICGARTKKGTPCQRRVRGTGRCWQHRGLPAMLPASKLIVQGP